MSKGPEAIPGRCFPAARPRRRDKGAPASHHKPDAPRCRGGCEKEPAADGRRLPHLHVSSASGAEGNRHAVDTLARAEGPGDGSPLFRIGAFLASSRSPRRPGDRRIQHIASSASQQIDGPSRTALLAIYWPNTARIGRANVTARMCPGDGSARGVAARPSDRQAAILSYQGYAAAGIIESSTTATLRGSQAPFRPVNRCRLGLSTAHVKLADATVLSGGT